MSERDDKIVEALMQLSISSLNVVVIVRKLTLLLGSMERIAPEERLRLLNEIDVASEQVFKTGEEVFRSVYPGDDV